AKPAVIFGKGQAQQTELCIPRPQGAAPPVRLGEIGAALVEAIVIGEQPLDRLAQQPLLFSQIKIHRSVQLGTNSKIVGWVEPRGWARIPNRLDRRSASFETAACAASSG